MTNIKRMIAELQSLDLQVYMRDDCDAHMFYTDGEHIGYAARNELSGMWKINSVHVPNRITGNGSTMCLCQGELPTYHEIIKGFSRYTEWLNPRQIKSITKYKSFADWHNADEWNKTYRLVDEQGDLV